MTRARRRRRRIWIATLCAVPTLAIVVAWLIGANASVFEPGRVLPERTRAGLAGHQFQWLSASNAVELDDLPPDYAPPAGTAAGDAWGRRYTESGKVGGVVDVRRGVEWHGNFATYFRLVTVPMWLPLLCTTPLLLVGAWQLYRVRQSSLRHRTGVCSHCGQERPRDATPCPACGGPSEHFDPVTAVFLTGDPPAATPLQPRNPH